MFRMDVDDHFEWKRVIFPLEKHRAAYENPLQRQKDDHKAGREKEERHSSSKDDKDGHLVYQPGDWLHSRCILILHYFVRL